MNKFKKIVLGVFGFLSLVTLLVNLLNYHGIKSLEIIIYAIVINFVIALLIIEISQFFYTLTNKKIIFLVAYILLFIIAFLYSSSEFIRFNYTYFITFSSVIFFFYIMGNISRILFILAILFIVFGIPLIIYRFEKIIPNNTEIRWKRLLILLGFFVILILSVNEELIRSASPITETFYPLLIEKEYLNYRNITIENNSFEKVLDLNISLKNPNIIVIMLESIPARKVHYYGYNRSVTPNIDKIAETGIVFYNAFSSASHSDLAQTAFLCSRYPLASKIKEIPLYNGYPADFIWDILKREGYKTAYFSSSNDNLLGMREFYNKTNLDVNIHSLSDGIGDYSGYDGKKDYDNNTLNRAIEWVNQSKNNSFFLYVGTQSTHMPYTYPNESRVFLPDDFPKLSMFKRPDAEDFGILNNRFDNSLIEVDKQIGVLIEYLKEDNLMNNTIIILTSDHGEDLNEDRGYWGHGLGVYNSETQIPLIFYIPGVNPIKIRDNVKHIDVIPTILSLLKFNLSEKFQGTEMHKNKDIFLVAQNLNEMIGLVKGDIKYIIDLQTYKIEAYNISQDYDEKDNLFGLDNSTIYKHIYNPILVNWYNCQIEYYKKANWSEKITCG